MSNVIYVDFTPGFFDRLFQSIKYNGIERTEKIVLKDGAHPSFVKAAMKKMIKERGW